MILDKITFARLISYITAISGKHMELEEIEHINYVFLGAKDQSVIASTINNEKAANELLIAITDENYIEMVKAYRTLTGLGVIDSKKAIDKFRLDHAKNFRWLDRPAQA